MFHCHVCVLGTSAAVHTAEEDCLGLRPPGAGQQNRGKVSNNSFKHGILCFVCL